MTMSDDNLIDFPLSEQDEADLAKLGTFPEEGLPEPEFHTILEVWREILKPAAVEATKKVTPQWASRMVSLYPKLSYADINTLRDKYFGKIDSMLTMVLDEIATDEDCLSYTKPQDDALENAGHYKNLLRDWQVGFLQWELEWTCTDDDAAVELAAISEVHKMFFGDQGLTQFLDNIGFVWNEDDATALTAALEDHRAAYEEGQ